MMATWMKVSPFSVYKGSIFALGFLAVVVHSQTNFAINDIVGSISLALEYGVVVDTISFTEYMESAAFLLRSGFPPISILDLCGSILSCLSYRKSITNQKSWFESLVSCTLMQFGGTTLTGWLLGQTPSWIVSHSAFPALIVAWWLTFFCPFDLFYNVINRMPLFLFIVGIFSAISGGHAVTSWGVDKALNNTFHVNHVRISQSFLTCIACGALSASGGGILADVLKFSHPTKSYTLSETPSIFLAGKYGSSATISRSFYLALIYYSLRNEHSYFPWSTQAEPATARAFICVLQVLHFIISYFFSIDVFQIFSMFLVHRVFGITPLVGSSEKKIEAKNNVKVVNQDVIKAATIQTKNEKDSKKKK